ncbi:MAG: 30S ribosomal protein S6 [Candidatus Omnitrophica bacterium]|nr:30S ribosomal protein S6 [Candidatus Omnitrophota bacterium]
MNKYEAMFIVKPDLSEEDKKAALSQVNDVITKNKGTVAEAVVWAERRKLCFPIKKYQEGIYYLVNFEAPPESITEIRYLYRVNENLLRVMITRIEK